MSKLRNDSKIFREVCLSFLGGKCKNCNSTYCLNIHHIDSNFMNNNKNNILLLCKNCHGLIHGKEKSKDDKYRSYLCDCGFGLKGYNHAKILFKLRNHLGNCKKFKGDLKSIK